MSTRRFRSIIANVMLLGFALVAFGLWFNSFADGNPAEIECDGSECQPVTPALPNTRGSAKTESYEQLVASKTRSVAWNQKYPLPIAGCGAILIVGGGLVLFALPDSTATRLGTATNTGTGSETATPDWWNEGGRP